jgi:ribbon-helix-helix CopG family protein
VVRTQIQLPEQQSAALKKLAAARRVSIAELIRGAVDMMIRSGMEINNETKKKRAMAVVTRFRSGKRDVSKDHDRYLSKAFGK